jgi:hypothetical protein
MVNSFAKMSVIPEKLEYPRISVWIYKEMAAPFG